MCYQVVFYCSTWIDGRQSKGTTKQWQMERPGGTVSVGFQGRYLAASSPQRRSKAVSFQVRDSQPHGTLPPHTDRKILQFSAPGQLLWLWTAGKEPQLFSFPLCSAPFLPIHLYKHNRHIAGIKLSCSRSRIKQRSKDIFYYLSPCLKADNGRLISHMSSFTNSPEQGFLLFNLAFFSQKFESRRYTRKLL